MGGCLGNVSAAGRDAPHRNSLVVKVANEARAPVQLALPGAPPPDLAICKAVLGGVRVALAVRLAPVLRL